MFIPVSSEVQSGPWIAQFLFLVCSNQDSHVASYVFAIEMSNLDQPKKCIWHFLKWTQSTVVILQSFNSCSIDNTKTKSLLVFICNWTEPSMAAFSPEEMPGLCRMYFICENYYAKSKQRSKTLCYPQSPWQLQKCFKLPQELDTLLKYGPYCQNSLELRVALLQLGKTSLTRKYWIRCAVVSQFKKKKKVEYSNFTKKKKKKETGIVFVILPC